MNYKNRHKYQYIPENLDINHLASLLPPDSKLDRDKLAFIVSSILNVSSTHRKDRHNSMQYVPLYSNILSSHLHNYKAAITHLVEYEVIASTETYAPGVCSISYKIEDKYVARVKAIPVKNHRFRQSLIHQEAKRISRKKKELRECKYLDKWFESPNLHFDHVKAKIIMDNMWRYSTEISHLSPIIYSTEIISARQLQTYSYTISKCENRDYTYGKDATSGRYHSPITNLKRKFRSCFTFYENKIEKQIYQIDIVNSQPFLLQMILSPSFWTSQVPLIRYFHTTHSEVPTTLMSVITPETLDTSDVQSLIKSVNNGTYYEDFMRQGFTHLGVQMTRTDAKIATYQVFFSHNSWRGSRPNNPQWDATLKELFITLYPNVYKVIETIKRGHKEALAVLLQNIESYLIIDVCCKRISKEKPLIPIFTIHDSIASTQEHMPYIQKVIEEEFEKFVGKVPKTKIEQW
jgi:hypothetical protein